ncbi:MAG: hypothetical protein ACAI43_00415 [Phycisphaerae bacterium]
MTRRRGYILPLTLALLVLAATLMTAVSRIALRRAADARVATDDLQRRWGAASIRKAVVPRADQILSLAHRAAPAKPNPARVDLTLRLGRFSYDLVVSDEQAKANLNAILEEADASRCESRLRSALSGSGLANQVRFRPTVGPLFLPPTDSGAPTPPPSADPEMAVPNPPLFKRPTAPHVSGLGQVFDGVEPGRLIMPAAGQRLAPVDLFTLWGTGAVNARRAPAAALNLAAGKALSQTDVSRLIAARDAMARGGGSMGGKSPAQEFKAQLADAIASGARAKANFALIEYSQCHSLWVVTRGQSRTWYDLTVVDASNSTRPVTHHFEW